MKSITIILFSTLIFSGAFASAGVPGEYGIHLFFDEKEFVDTMTISQNAEGNLTGNMDVPNDFSGPLMNLKVDGLKVEFDLLVPKNSSRPVDLAFHYVGHFFDQTYNQLIGFVIIEGSEDFTASFTAFKRK
jgi:hypothetical protein